MKMEGGDGPALDDEEPAVLQGPLRILGEVIMLLNRVPDFSEFDNLVVGQLWLVDLPGRYLYFFDAAGVFVNLHDGLFGNQAGVDGKTVFFDDVVIGSDDALDNIVAQTPGGLDDDLEFVVGDRINGKHHPRNFRLDHQLDGNGEGDPEVVETLAGAVIDRPGAKERGPGQADGLDDVGFTLDV